MINFTVGPVQLDENTMRIGGEQIPYFRTPEFSTIMKENERLICSLADCDENARAVFITGSGTASMEASVMNFFTKKDKVLVVNGGSFGHRFVELCTIHEVPFEEIKLGYGQPLTKEILSQYNPQDFTGFILQLCETSTGVLYDMSLVADFCSKSNLFLLVDAISGLFADEFSMKRFGVGAMITGSQKALALPSGLSIIVMSERAATTCKNNDAKCLYLNLSEALKDGERGQTPFTPAVGILLQLNEKLKRIAENGGYAEQKRIISERAEYFRGKISDLPLDFFIARGNMSNCVTALTPRNKNVSAYTIFEILKDEYGIWICPNGGELKDKVIRVGHIGALSKSDSDALIAALNDMNKRELLEP